MAVSLLTPVLENGILNTYFFQGRVLSAEDLQTEQVASRTHRRHLGRAIGPGIIEGLQVSLVPADSADAPPNLKVAPGVALNAEGQDLRLATAATIALTGPTDPLEPEAGLFKPCEKLDATFVRSGDGVYVLVMSPASGFRERAPMSGLDRDGKAPGCGSRYAVEGVQFRLEFFDPTAVAGLRAATSARLSAAIGTTPLAANDLSRLSRYRNLLAHVSFGSEQVDAFLADPFAPAGPPEGASPEHGLLDHLVALDRLNDCDVPLASFYWSADGVLFLDTWAARRQVALHLKPAPAFIPEARRLAEAQARLSQFQTHLAFLLERLSAPTSVEVQNYFHVLPPVGLVPLVGPAQPEGFSESRFFQAFALEPPKPIDVSQLPKLLFDSLLHGPIDLDDAPFVQLYEIAAGGRTDGAARPFLIFASRHLPYVAATPRFRDLCRTLEDARDSYRRLITRSAFLGTEVDPASAPARSAIIGSIEAVVATASAWAAACSGLVHLDHAIEALRDLYTLQKDLTEVFLEPRPSLGDESDLHSFARQLRLRLDGPVTTAVPALGPALAAGALPAILASQREINLLVSNRTTSEPVHGNITVIYQTSTRGRTLVLGDSNPFTFVIRVRNDTNRTLDVQLEARFLSPRESWTPFSTVLDESGSEIAFLSLQPFDPSRPGDPAATRDVRVQVFTPAGATDGESGDLQLRAFVPPPIQRSGADIVRLSVGTAETPEETTAVRIQPGSPVPDSNINRARVNNTITFRFALLFHTEAAPFTRDFTMSWSVVSGNASVYSLLPPSAPFTLSTDVEADIFPRIRPLPGAEGTTLSVQAVIQSVDGSVPTLTGGPYQITTLS